MVYDSGHRFDVQGANDDAPVAVNSIEDFEKALAAYLANSPETTACLQWSGYDPDRLNRVATFELWRTAKPVRPSWDELHGSAAPPHRASVLSLSPP